MLLAEISQEAFAVNQTWLACDFPGLDQKTLVESGKSHANQAWLAAKLPCVFLWGARRTGLLGYRINTRRSQIRDGKQALIQLRWVWPRTYWDIRFQILTDPSLAKMDYRLTIPPLQQPTCSLMKTGFESRFKKDFVASEG